MLVGLEVVMGRVRRPGGRLVAGYWKTGRGIELVVT